MAPNKQKTDRGELFPIPGHSKEICIEYNEETGHQEIEYLGVGARALGIDRRPVHNEGKLWVTATDVEYMPNAYTDGYINIITPYEDKSKRPDQQQ